MIESACEKTKSQWVIDHRPWHRRVISKQRRSPAVPTKGRIGDRGFGPDEVAWRRNLVLGSNQCLAIVLEVRVLVACCGILSEWPCSIEEPPKMQTVTSIDIRGGIVASHDSNPAEEIGS
jgi:hypothetical protein